jgi:iron complex outermembrane recepter protein
MRQRGGVGSGLKTRRVGNVVTVSALIGGLGGLSSGVFAQAAQSPGGQTTDVQAPVPTTVGTVQDVLVTTGNRGDQRTVTDNPVPVDIIGGDQLQQLGANTSLRDALAQLIPSFNVQTQPSANWDSVVRPAGLRGLSGSHTLVLVNGKRRHNSSLMTQAGTVDNGDNPVDLDLIPISAIDHIEILRDGAAAQYGSDAVAGVINIILKSNDHGITSNTTAGGRYHYADNVQNGAQVQEAVDVGFKLPNQGFINFAIDAKHEDATVRNTQATGTFYFPLPNGQPDPRNATVSKDVYQGGLPKIDAVNLSYNAEIPINPDLKVYSFSTVSRRDAWGGQNFRAPNSPFDIPQIFPTGYSPYYTLNETDYQSVVGVRGKVAGWSWDLSTSYGSDRALSGVENTLNASLGPNSPTSFSALETEFSQWTNTLDFTRAFDIGLKSPLQVSTGLEMRHEQFQTEPGELASYENGGYIYPSGPLAGHPAAVGAESAYTVTPSDAASISRNNYASYLDFSLNPTERWFVDLAGRFEHYDDSSGNTWSGKIATRYQLTSSLAIRGSVNNGFRAPSLPQEAFAQTSDKGVFINGVGEYISDKLVQVNSPLGRALGAEPLSPEKSLDYGLGLVFTPTKDINVTVDAYQIDLNNRIAETGFLGGPGVNQILAQYGVPSGTYVQYFANALDTRTQGVDVVGDYTQDLHQWGAIKWTLGFNYNHTAITGIKNTPAQLAALGLSLLDRQAQGDVTVANPSTKLILGADWAWGNWEVNLRETRYGGVTLEQDDPADDQHYGAKWLTDIDVAYQINKHTTIAIGANNLFNTYPDKNTASNTSGFSPYSSISPFGFYGGFYYARLTLVF